MFKTNSGEKCPTDSVSLVLGNHFQTKLIEIVDVENIILVIFLCVCPEKAFVLYIPNFSAGPDKLGL